MEVCPAETISEYISNSEIPIQGDNRGAAHRAGLNNFIDHLLASVKFIWMLMGSPSSVPPSPLSRPWMRAFPVVAETAAEGCLVDDFTRRRILVDNPAMLYGFD